MNLAELRRYLFAAYIDVRLFLTGKAERDLPPLRLRDVGQGDFRAIGEGLAALLVRHGLAPHHRVLDIGCGVGRVALPLTRLLSPRGSYEGIDIVKRWVGWCRRHITPAHPSFRFTHADIFNSHYNRSGVPAAQFRFPYDDASFDFAFATSVFTHLDLDAAKHYLREAHRVLRPGGVLVATFFFWDETIVNPALDFRVNRGEYRLLDETDPDWAIAFDARIVDALLPASHWCERTIEPGRWRGAEGEFQDVVRVVTKSANS
jgi:SAM-dependent methyltransferase